MIPSLVLFLTMTIGREIVIHENYKYICERSVPRLNSRKNRVIWKLEFFGSICNGGMSSCAAWVADGKPKYRKTKMRCKVDYNFSIEPIE